MRRAIGLVVTVLLAACVAPKLPVATTAPPAPLFPSSGPTVVTPSASAADDAVWAGLAWTAPIRSEPPAIVSDLIATPNGFVAVGFQGAAPGSAAAAWASPDLGTWTQTLLDAPAAGDSGLQWVRPTSDGLVAIGTSGVLQCIPPEGEGQVCDPLPIAIWTSSDGASWTRARQAPVLVGVRAASVASDGETVILVGDAGWTHPGIWRSSDGAIWVSANPQPDTFAEAHFDAVAVIPGHGWVVTGSTGGSEPECCVGHNADATPAAWFSADGNTWEPARVVDAAASRGDVIGPVFAGRDGLVAWSLGEQDNDFGWQSPDGRTWTALSKPTGNPITPRAADGARIIGTSFDGADRVAEWISTDGLRWNRLAPSGDLGHRPTWSDGGNADAVYLLPGGVAWIGRDVDGSPILWRTTATP